MANLIIIAAIGMNYELGKENKLIWNISEDMKFFKEKTTGHYIIMGRKTYEAIPSNLANRKYIVLSKNNILYFVSFHYLQRMCQNIILMQVLQIHSVEMKKS